jgi:hypothetical protein
MGFFSRSDREDAVERSSKRLEHLERHGLGDNTDAARTERSLIRWHQKELAEEAGQDKPWWK